MLIWTSELKFGLTFQNAFTIIREMIALMIAQCFYGIYFHCEIVFCLAFLTLASDSAVKLGLGLDLGLKVLDLASTSASRIL